MYPLSHSYRRDMMQTSFENIQCWRLPEARGQFPPACKLFSSNRALTQPQVGANQPHRFFDNDNAESVLQRAAVAMHALEDMLDWFDDPSHLPPTSNSSPPSVVTTPESGVPPFVDQQTNVKRKQCGAGA